MCKVLILYSSSEGQTAKIAGEIAHALGGAGIAASRVEVRAGEPEPNLEGYDAIVLGSSVHIGKHGKAFTRLVRANAARLSSLPTAFYSVSLSSASKDPNLRDEARQLANEFLAMTGWRPSIMACFAGALKYSSYGPVKRWLMRQIAAKNGGDTDTSHDHEYTDWASVRAFAGDVALLARRHLRAAA